MANPLRGEAELVADGEVFTLALDFNALCTLEDRLDLSVGDIIERLKGDVRGGFLRAVFHVALERHHPALTEAEVGDLIGRVGLAPVLLAVWQAIGAAFPAPTKGDGKGAGADAAPGPRKTRRRGPGTSKPSS